MVSRQEAVCILPSFERTPLTKDRTEGADFSEQRLLFGTNTSQNQEEYIQIARVQIPDFGEPSISRYNPDTGEVGGHGEARTPFKFDIIQKIRHDGEVNKARYMPQNPNIIATMSSNATAQVFDRSKHPLMPKDNEFIPQIILRGHSKEGFGLNWSPILEGNLATASEDCTVCVFDIKGFTQDSRYDMQPIRTFSHHTATVNDVEYHPTLPQIIGTVSDDLTLQILDTRSPEKDKPLMKQEAHADAVNCLAFHPKWQPILATGSADNTVALWDMRNLKTKLHSIEAHRASVIKIEWSPHNAAFLGSASYDRRINFLDLSKAGEEQTPEEAEDGPPELYDGQACNYVEPCTDKLCRLFMHGGFTNRISDFSWNPHDPWVIFAAAEDNQIQIFKPAKTITQADVLKGKVQMREIEE